MPTTVRIPDVGVVRFPDGMTQDEISAAITFQILGQTSQSFQPTLGNAQQPMPEQQTRASSVAELAGQQPTGFVQTPMMESEQNEMIREAQTPLVPLPKLTKEDARLLFGQNTPTAIPDAIAGVQQALMGTLESFTTPEMLPVLPVTIGLGAGGAAGATAAMTGARTIAGAFAADMIAQTPDLAKEIAEGAAAGDTERVARASAQAALNAFMASQAGKFAVHGRGPAVTEGRFELIPETERAARESAARQQLESPALNVEARVVEPSALPPAPKTPTVQMLEDRARRLLPERGDEPQPVIPGTERLLPAPIESLTESVPQKIASINYVESVAPFGEAATVAPQLAWKVASGLRNIGLRRGTEAEDIAAGRKPYPTKEAFAQLVESNLTLDAEQLLAKVRDELTDLGFDSRQAKLPTRDEFASAKDFWTAAFDLESRMRESGASLGASLVRAGQITPPAKPRTATQVTPEPAPETPVEAKVEKPTLRDPLGNDAAFYIIGNVKAMRMRRDPLLDRAQKFYGAKSAEDLSKIALARFAERQAALEAPRPVPPSETETVTKPKRQPKDRPWDIIDEIEASVGKIRTKAAAKAGSEGYYGELYKEARSGSAARLFSESGGSPDEAVDSLRRSGFFSEDAGVDDLWMAISKAKKARTAHFAGTSPEAKLEKFTKAWDAQVKKRGTKLISVGDLAIGNRFKLGGEEFTVTKIDPDTGEVTVQDGWKYGSQTIPDGADVPVELGSLKQKKSSTKFLPPEQPTKVAKLRPGEEHGDILAKIEEPFALVGEKGVDVARIAQEKEVAAKRADEARQLQEAQQAKLFDLAGNDPIANALAEQAATENPPPPIGEEPPLSDSGRSGNALGISPLSNPPLAAKFIRDFIGQAVKYPLRWYSESLIGRLASLGDIASKEFADIARRIVSLAKKEFGELSTSGELDSALKLSGRWNEATTWIQGIERSGNNPWGYARIVKAIEDPTSVVPGFAQELVNQLRRVSRNIGDLAQRYIQGFIARGLFQREPTAFLVDVIRVGRGAAHDLLARALSTDNGMPEPQARAILNEIKAEWDKPGTGQSINRIAQEFHRQFRKFPTHLHLNGPLGKVWVELLHSSPFDYLTRAAQNTTSRVAFIRYLTPERLNEYRARVAAEGRTARAFDDLVRALHGLPIDEPLFTEWIPPGSPIGLTLSGANLVLRDVFSPLKLSASSIYNIPETILGNTPTFVGWRSFIEGVYRSGDLYSELETLGAINKAIYNNSVSPNSRLRGHIRQFGNGIRAITAQRFLNELQELYSAASAYVIAERARGQSLSENEKRQLKELARMMGFDPATADRIGDGTAADTTYDQFIRQFAPFSSAGNVAKAEQSAFQTQRGLSALFPFQSYAVKKMDSLRKVISDMADAVESGNSERIKGATAIAAKFLFNTVGQGAASTFLRALAYGGIAGLAIQMSQSEDEPGEFLFDSIAAGMSGPLAAIWYAQNNEGLQHFLNPDNLIRPSKTFPGAIYMELRDFFTGTGRFKNLSPQDRITRYFVERVPAGRIADTVIAATGLSGKDKALDAAKRGLERWRTDKYGFVRVEDLRKKDETDNEQFRIAMGKVVEAINNGKDPRSYIPVANQFKNQPDSISKSLLARRWLVTADRKLLSTEERQELKKYIGEAAYNKLEARDRMLVVWANVTKPPSKR